MKQIRVLLIEDHFLARMALHSVLSGHPQIHIVGEAGDGRSALEGIAATRPAAVLLDLSMPDMNGLEAILAIRESDPDVAIILIGGNDVTHASARTAAVRHLSDAVRRGHQIVVLSRRPGQIRDILRIDRPLSGRTAADPDLVALEQNLWRMIRDDAAVAERERINAPA